MAAVTNRRAVLAMYLSQPPARLIPVGRPAATPAVR